MVKTAEAPPTIIRMTFHFFSLPTEESGVTEGMTVVLDVIMSEVVWNDVVIWIDVVWSDVDVIWSDIISSIEDEEANNDDSFVVSIAEDVYSREYDGNVDCESAVNIEEASFDDKDSSNDGFLVLSEVLTG